jgi:hypothetical protein
VDIKTFYNSLCSRPGCKFGTKHYHCVADVQVPAFTSRVRFAYVHFSSALSSIRSPRPVQMDGQKCKYSSADRAKALMHGRGHRRVQDARRKQAESGKATPAQAALQGLGL